MSVLPKCFCMATICLCGAITVLSLKPQWWMCSCERRRWREEGWKGESWLLFDEDFVPVLWSLVVLAFCETVISIISWFFCYILKQIQMKCTWWFPFRKSKGSLTESFACYIKYPTSKVRNSSLPWYVLSYLVLKHDLKLCIVLVIPLLPTC